MRTALRSSAFVVLAQLLVAHAANGEAYLFTDVGTLGGNQSEAWAINDKCQIVGWAETQSGTSHAFVWENGVMTDLGTLGGDTDSFATDINNSGQIVGSSGTSTGKEHAFLWQQGVMVDLGTLDGDSLSYASAINDRGQIVGRSQSDSGVSRAVLWTDGSTLDLGTLGGTHGNASDINQSGRIVGESTTAAGESHAFVWYQGVMADMGTLDGLEIAGARAINDRSQFVGEATNVAYVFDHGVMTGLPRVGSFNDALDLNNRGQIVGWDGFGLGVRAVVWGRDGSIRDLACPPEHAGNCASGAEGINSSSDIVGWAGRGPGGQRAALWTSKLGSSACHVKLN